MPAVVGAAGAAALTDEPASLPKAYFDALFAADPDPWGLKSRDYERDKYQDTLAALEGRRFRAGVEVGCASGELSAILAPSCESYLGLDIAEEPLRQARARNADQAGAAFARLTLPDERPEGRFDLIVLSEVLYYFSRADVAKMAAWARSALSDGGVVLLVHWLGETPDYPLTGDEAVEAFMTACGEGLTTDRRWRRALYRIDRLACPPPSG
ncbi:class I SAM-dependent methyltransferase [soil metagenome]